jgi:twitching motility two-component system response regulator PilH
MPKTIMIVEDDEIARVGLATILQAHGYRTMTAAQGHEALDQLQTGLCPDLILLDMLLPECDGWEFCAQRRHRPTVALVPVVIMTGVGEANDEWAKSLGAVALLRKPLDVLELLETIRRITGGTGRSPRATQQFPT